ncbi:PAS domain-containing protein [Mucilaginibacter robiniae]|uniref:histidine kinase n=1 Tax=Mucilaginibacter robiniae TaxID=2728022 RepID=A0A7L5E6F0_9SPHI|nr:PAS domain-containing protein [Mucilaginibacter robiniae]QJD98218.1 PAS domain-containing protein [Mucilaginibacter robiniae]
MNNTTLLTCNQLLNIFSSSHIATAIYTTDDLIVEAVTDAMLAFWGKDRSIVGLPLAIAVPELQGQVFIAQLQSVLRTGNTFNGTNVPAELYVDDRLQVKYYDYEYRALQNSEGEIYCLLHTATDVTERVLGSEAVEKEHRQSLMLEREQVLNGELSAANEELFSINEELRQTQDSLHELNMELESRVAKRTSELAESESNLRYMIDDAPVAIAVFKGPDFIVEQANQYVLKIWGKSDAVIGKTIYQALPEIEGQSFFPVLKQVFESGEAFLGNEAPGIMEYNGVLKQIYTNFVFKPLKNENGVTHSIMIVATEVTEQVHNRLAIEAAKYRFQVMVSNTPVAMAILRGRELVIEQANQPMLNIWRRNSEQVIGFTLTDVFPELVDQPNPARMRNVFETKERIALPETPVTLAAVDGSLHTHYAKFSYDPILDQNGNVESLLVTVIDITELVESRNDLEFSKAELQETTEELAATNEELTVINEEMMASNEELVSTNEELIAIQDQLQLTVHELKDSEERFRFLLNAMPQQVWTATPDGTINYVNQLASQQLGYDSEVAVSYGWQKFIHPEDFNRAAELWMKSLKTGKDYTVEFRIRFADGSYYWHLGKAVPLIENGQIKLWIGTNTNIDLQKANEQKKDEFLSIASHELKTPLTSIKAFNQIMQRTRDTEKLSNFMSKSSEHILRLEKLISDLLDVTKLNAGKLEYHMQPFSFKQLLKDSIESVQHISPSHQIMLESAVEITFTGDQFRLEQVINNFLSNAVKYSPKGEKVVVKSWLDNDHVTVSVQDFGIGIDQAHIDKLFDRYYRVDNTAMRFEGLGLGLFISSEVLKRHQGRFWIESEPGKGSTFYFSIPVLTPKNTVSNSILIDLNQDLSSENIRLN